MSETHERETILSGAAETPAIAELLDAIREARIADLEWQLEREGWQRLTDGESGREFSRAALDTLIERSRAFYLKNPLIHRGVEVSALYVWGQDLSVTAPDEDVRLVIDRFWRDNAATLTGQQASRLLEIELFVTGNVFLALFPDRVSGAVRVRQVPVEEMREIVTNPDDRAEVWFYRREWQSRPLDRAALPERRVAYYPDWRYWERATERPLTINGEPVIWDAPVVHVKVGAFPHWLWGVPETYSALDWAKAYKDLLQDDATRSRALARFALRASVRGGTRAVAAVQKKLSTTLGEPGGMGIEHNPPPVAGATAVLGEGYELDVVRVAGAFPPTDHARPFRIMVAAALGLPDTFLGDVDQGNLATAKTLDRPTELRYAERRQLWREFFADLLQWVIDRDLEATAGILRGAVTAERREITVSWPDILERDVRERVAAIIDAATLGGRDLAGVLAPETVTRELAIALNLPDPDGEIAAVYEDDLAAGQLLGEALLRRLAEAGERTNGRVAP